MAKPEAAVFASRSTASASRPSGRSTSATATATATGRRRPGSPSSLRRSLRSPSGSDWADDHEQAPARPLHAGDPLASPPQPGRESPSSARSSPRRRSPFERVADLGAVIAEEEYGFTYARLRNPTVEELDAVLARLEGAEAARTFSSGMAAISAALNSTLAAGDTLLLPNQLYGTTFQLAESQLRPRGVDLVYLDVTDAAAWERPAHVRYVETMANPGFPLADLEALAATKGDGLLIVDNTFASPVLCRPLELRGRPRLRVGNEVPQRPSRRHGRRRGREQGARRRRASAPDPGRLGARPVPRLPHPTRPQDPHAAAGAGQPERANGRGVPRGKRRCGNRALRRPRELPAARAGPPAARRLGRDDGLRARRRPRGGGALHGRARALRPRDEPRRRRHRAPPPGLDQPPPVLARAARGRGRLAGPPSASP